MITVGTPVVKGILDTSQLDEAVLNIGKYLKKGQLIILKSTVAPGTTYDVALKLEKLSGLKAGKDFYIAFSPERTIEGLALYELYSLLKIVGGINKESLNRATQVLKKLGGGVIEVSSPTVAEICKLADNLYRAMNIALSNEIGYICEKLGVDAYEVVFAVNNAYKRTNLFMPGLGADGPCLSKDPLIVKYCAEKLGIRLPITNACIIQNEYATLRITSLISDFLRENKVARPKISLIGLAFKGFPETDDIRGSPAIKIERVLKKQFVNLEFRYYDPIIKVFAGRKTYQTLEECITKTNVVAFLTNHRAIMNVDAEEIISIAGRPLLIIDCWHNLTNIKRIGFNDVKIFRVGSGEL
jgi:UDP-N-acetyl-D-mannosaminuronic acid dehydrogenase